jgi:hypothetical protein
MPVMDELHPGNSSSNTNRKSARFFMLGGGPIDAVKNNNTHTNRDSRYSSNLDYNSLYRSNRNSAQLDANDGTTTVPPTPTSNTCCLIS